jgi:hypothetical protein
LILRIIESAFAELATIVDPVSDSPSEQEKKSREKFEAGIDRAIGVEKFAQQSHDPIARKLCSHH